MEAVIESKAKEPKSENPYMESFTGMLTVMFMLYDKVEEPDQLSDHLKKYLEVFESISDQPYEIIMICFRCVIVGMSMEDFTEMIAGTLSKENVEKKYEDLLRQHFTNTEEESRLNARMNQLILQVEESIDYCYDIQMTYAEEMKKDKETIIRMSEERLADANEKTEHYKALVEEHKARVYKLEEKLANMNVANGSIGSSGYNTERPEKTGLFQRRKLRKSQSVQNSEMVRFRKAFAENEEYSEEQRDFLTMCFGDPDSKRRLSYEEIVMIASPRLSVNQMEVLRERVLQERG